MKLGKTYNPSDHELDIYKLWEETGAFTPKNRGGQGSFTITVPPPNANGNLHLGHGLTIAIEDVATRYQRMQGKAALLLPGADHAGFETQVVYEKVLASNEKSRFDFSREELYSQIWDFVAENKDNYQTQFRKLGASVDWSRYVYTLDKKIVDRAYETFQKMWNEGLIYRGERLVNFCTHHGTGFADIEVEYRNVKGYLWHIDYPLTDGSGKVTVATTRPETMLGDVAVAVHPDDKKLAKFVGKTIKLPLTNREIPIIADEMVQTEFGTGAVKITPAHDQNDYEVAERHDLPMITVISHEGKMTHEAGDFAGLEVKQARKQVVKALEAEKLLAKTEDYEHSVGHCYKCGTVIEPLLREQWFINMKPLAKEALKALEAEKIKFYPDNKRTQLIEYLKNLRDWNISRQIAWGIPIPAFQNIDDEQDWIFDTRVKQETIEVNGKTYRRDPDVFDTWFSSSSWPYATLDYPDGKDFNEHYPLSLMETGADILYPWVSRMIMFGLYVTGEVPFKQVYLHGLIQDEHGAKMSKSKGNVVNPMEKIDQYGSDAFRMGIIADESAGNNRPYDESKLIGARNFCNKLWNIARFIENKVGDTPKRGSVVPKTISDHWVLARLKSASERVGELLENYQLAEAYEVIYHAVWDDVADWYIEASKSSENDGMLGYVLEVILKLAHPFAPFVTEAIWQNLGDNKENLLITAPWPIVTDYDNQKAKEFEQIKALITELRQLSKNLKLSKPTLNHTVSSLISENDALIKQLTGAGEIVQSSSTKGVRLLSAQAWLDVEDSKLKEYQKEITEKIKAKKAAIDNFNKRLANRSYTENAPKHIVEETMHARSKTESNLDLLETELKRFS
ncbi:valine--tRNA ligase [Candidatus Saccharibacteria bacterium]|nr:valine--tRNA ligase [Candidatus Saccharibacteria bacterium]